MIYGLIRFLIIVALVISVIAIFKKTNFKRTYKYIVCAILIVAFTILITVTFENYLVSFKSPEAAFKYISYGKLVNVLEGDQSSCVLYIEPGSSNSDVRLMVFPKMGGGYKLGTNYSLEMVGMSLSGENYSVVVYKYNYSEDYYVKISVLSTSQNSNVSDNLSWDFSQYVCKASVYNIYTAVYSTYIKDISSDYEIVVNGDPSFVFIHKN